MEMILIIVVLVLLFGGGGGYWGRSRGYWCPTRSQCIYAIRIRHDPRRTRVAPGVHGD